jgi:steroid delta-isomerase-like uncharacterized protein
MSDAAELGKRWFEAIEAGDIEGAMGLLADDVEFDTPSGPMRGTGLVRPFVQGYIDGFPDGTFELKSEVSVGSRAALEGVYAGTNTGAMATPQGEMPATGRSVSIPFVTIFESVDGERISSHRVYWDQMAFMTQLGIAGEAPQS